MEAISTSCFSRCPNLAKIVLEPGCKLLNDSVRDLQFVTACRFLPNRREVKNGAATGRDQENRQTAAESEILDRETWSLS
jgi:hypothetical protein